MGQPFGKALDQFLAGGLPHGTNCGQDSPSGSEHVEVGRATAHELELVQTTSCPACVRMTVDECRHDHPPIEIDHHVRIESLRRLTRAKFRDGLIADQQPALLDDGQITKGRTPTWRAVTANGAEA